MAVVKAKRIKRAGKTRVPGNSRGPRRGSMVGAEHLFKPGENPDRNRPPFTTKTEDRLRVKLQGLMDKMARQTSSGASTRRLPTIAGINALSIATRYIEGGRSRFVEFVQLAMLNGNQAAQLWLEVFADLAPNEREVVSFDDVCAASGVRPADLVAAVAGTAVTIGIDTGNLVAALTHPQVVAASVKYAKTESGIEDRRMMFQHANFIPIPKNAAPTVVVNANASAVAGAQASAETVDAGGVPSFAADLKRVSQGIIPRAALPAAEPVEDFTFDVVPEGELVPVAAHTGDDTHASDDFDVE
jgi:hypothetical protein